jgi:hypothetical protein
MYDKAARANVTSLPQPRSATHRTAVAQLVQKSRQSQSVGGLPAREAEDEDLVDRVSLDPWLADTWHRS